MSEEELVEIMLSNGTIVDNCLIYGDLTLGLHYGYGTLNLRSIDGTEIMITNETLRDRFCFLIARKRGEEISLQQEDKLKKLYEGLPRSLTPTDVAEHVACNGQIVKTSKGYTILYGRLRLTMEEGWPCLLVLSNYGKDLRKYSIFSATIKQTMKKRREDHKVERDKMFFHSKEMIEEADL